MPWASSSIHIREVHSKASQDLGTESFCSQEAKGITTHYKHKIARSIWTLEATASIILLAAGGFELQNCLEIDCECVAVDHSVRSSLLPGQMKTESHVKVRHKVVELYKSEASQAFKYVRVCTSPLPGSNLANKFKETLSV